MSTPSHTEPHGSSPVTERNIVHELKQFLGIPTDKPMSPDDGVRMGIHLQRVGNFEAAQTVFQAVLKAVPKHPATLHFYGILHHQLGQSEQALALMRKSLALAPGQWGWMLNLGNVLLEMARFEEAGQLYEEAAALQPDNEPLLNNLAILRKSLGDLEGAEKLYRRALEINPEYFEAHNNLGNLLMQKGLPTEALQHFFRALTLAPENADSLRLLGLAYGSLGELDKAAEAYRRWVEQEPDNPQARHYLAACEQTNVPERAANDYVEKTFDNFAASFDAKLSALSYRAPELIAQAVNQLPDLPLNQGQLQIVDAGCGTGLCGPLLAPHARTLVGVDLSAEMLKRAAERGHYSELIHAELTGFLQSRHVQDDLIISADTLCYFGRLEEVVAAAMEALRPGGWLVFSAESLDAVQDPAPAAGEQDTGYRLFHHGRYAHRQAYIDTVLRQAGAQAIAFTPVVLRMESAAPVHGMIVQCQKPGAPTGA